MSRVLLSNDDGVDSPALVPFVRALAGADHEVTTVVPDGERSWIGKAVTRHDPITLSSTERDGVTLHTTSGTPADAVQLGVHEVRGGDVDVVVSGINLGFNHGVAFLLSSGTVGAAAEGWISGLPAVAFSTGTWGGDWGAWRQRVTRPDAAGAWTALASLCAGILDEVRVSGLIEVADVVSVNVPFEADVTTPRRVTRLARVGYGGLFRQVDDGRWLHRAVDLHPFEALDGTDVEAAGDHAITITPVRMPASPEVPGHVRSALERPS